MDTLGTIGTRDTMSLIAATAATIEAIVTIIVNATMVARCGTMAMAGCGCTGATQAIGVILDIKGAMVINTTTVEIKVAGTLAISVGSRRLKYRCN